jgi:hypothetical protein
MADETSNLKGNTMADEVKRINQAELEALLIRVRSARAVGIVALTVPSCFYAREGGSRKKDATLCPPVMKRGRVSGMTCFEYQRSRNTDNRRVWSREVERLRAEGKEDEARTLEQQGPEEHEMKGRAAGDTRERIDGTPFVRNAEGFLYVQMMIPTGNHPDWPSGSHEKAYVYGPYSHECLSAHYREQLAKGKKKAQAEHHATLAAPAESIEYSLEEDGEHSLHAWLKPYKRSESDPVDFDYREYRTDHILEVRHEGVRYIVVREGYEAEADELAA